MKLTNTQLSTLVHNSVSHHFDENGRLHLRRFTESQLNTYHQEDPHWVVRANASASVTFDFITDSDYVVLKFDLQPGSSQLWGSLDLYVDGVFTKSRYMADLGVKLAGFELPAGEHRVTLYFPWSMQIAINEVLLSDGASLQPVHKKRKILSFGDSITQGYISKYASLSYVNQMARALDAEVVNQGIGGYYFNEKTIDSSLTAFQPDLITVAYGTNDYSRYDSRKDFEAYTGAYIRKLEALFPNTTIVGILPIYRNDQNHLSRKLYREYSLDDARAILRGYYESCANGHVVEQTGIPHLSDVYASDFLHPNELGFTFMAQGIVRKLEALEK